MWSSEQGISFWLRAGKGIYFMLILLAYGELYNCSEEPQIVSMLVFLVLVLIYYWELLKTRK